MKGVKDVFGLNVGESIERGRAKVSCFEIDKNRAMLYNLRMSLSPLGALGFVSVGEYVCLRIGGTLYMSDTNMERLTNSQFVQNAKGDVMIAGLGIGLVLQALRPKVESGVVRSITVYEKFQDVIDLVYPYYKDFPLIVKCENVLEYIPPKYEKYDTIYFDIWPSIDTENLNEINLLHRRWKGHKRSGGWMNSWVNKELHDIRRKERMYED